MWPDLALVDQAALVLVHELDRVLDRDDVLVPVAVYVVDHGAERGRLARAGRSRDDDEALREVAELEHRLREAELLRRDDLAGDLPEDASGAGAVAEDVRAEAGNGPELVGEVRVVVLEELLPVRLGRDLEEHALDVLAPERCVPRLDGLHLPVDAHHGHRARGEVKVRRLPGDDDLEVAVELGHFLSRVPASARPLPARPFA